MVDTSLPDNRSSWKIKVDLYSLIQKLCDRPAYLWYNFRYFIIDSVPTGNASLTLDDMAKLGRGREIQLQIEAGFIDLQRWCDTY